MKNLILSLFLLIAFTSSAFAQTAPWDATDAAGQTTEMRIMLDIGASDIPSYFSLVPSIATGVFFNNSGNFVNDTGFVYDSAGNDLSILDNFEGDGYCDEAGANCFAPEDVATAANTVTFTNKTLALGGTGNAVTGTTAEFQTANTDGTFKIAGKETIWMPAGSIIPATTSGAAAATVETSTNKINYDVLDFDTSADEFGHFNVSFPKSWDLGTVTFQIFWTAATGGTTGIAFALQGVALSDNVTLDTAYGTAVVVTDDAQTGAEEVYVSAESAAVTISETPADNDIIEFRIFRDVSDANDDLAEDARLIGIKRFYTTDAEDDT